MLVCLDLHSHYKQELFFHIISCMHAQTNMYTHTHTHKHTHSHTYRIRLASAYLKNGTILVARISAVLNPCEYSITWAISCRSGFVIARLEGGRGGEIRRGAGGQGGARGEEGGDRW